MKGAVGMRYGLFPRAFSGQTQDVAKSESREKRLLEALLDRKWLLAAPDSMIDCISVTDSGGSQVAEAPLSCSYSNDRINPLGDIIKAKRRKDKFFFVLRDDLLHPLINGNKARKLDALLPVLGDHGVTDVVTCGGCQSAHTAAVAVSCSERGMRAHLLLRGEEPEVLTGYNLVSKMFGNVHYVPRSIYTKRGEMVANYADLVAGSNNSVIQISDILEDVAIKMSGEVTLPLDTITPKVVVINEGAGEVIGLLGGSFQCQIFWCSVSCLKVMGFYFSLHYNCLILDKCLLCLINWIDKFTAGNISGVIRLVEHLSQNHLFGNDRQMKIVVDAGTGTTAVGLALGALCLGLPWEITAVMLADDIDGYRRQERRLITEFNQIYPSKIFAGTVNREGCGILQWTERKHPRKFGNVLEGEVETCRKIAIQTGIFLDPVYTLAAWEQSTRLCLQEAEAGGHAQVVMLHTGGTLGMFGLAQRYKSHFQFPQPWKAPW